MNTIQAIIVDDETNSRSTLRSLLALCAPEIVIAGEAANTNAARELIEQKNPGLVFLDIQMPGDDGFELLQSIFKPAFKVIFTTAHQQYAVKAFRCSAVDYLLKPIDPDELVQAIHKARLDNHPIQTGQIELLQTHFETFKEAEEKKRPKRPPGNMKLALSLHEGIYFVLLKDIIWCESFGAYTKFHIAGQATILVSKVLKDYEEVLEEFYFFRTHKSSLINLEHVTKYVRGDGGQVWMSDGAEIEVSRRRKDELLEIVSTIFLSGGK
jgi:two-component system LytT family response regulator